MPIPVILDCDPGTDDAFALFLALAAPEIDLHAITVAGGNVGLDRTLPNTLSLLALADTAIPVHPGADRPILGAFVHEQQVHGADGLSGVRLPPGLPASPELAIDAIRRILRESDQPVVLVGIGPATNLAMAITAEPALLPKVARIVLMSGAWAEGNITPAAEFNAWSDPEALAILLRCGRPVELVTLELTAQALATPARLKALRRSGTGRCLATLCDIQDAVPLSRRFDHKGAALHDPCAIAWLIRPDLFTARNCFVEVDLGPGPGRGRTVIDRWDRLGRQSNATLLETIDADGFFALLAERLDLLP